MNVTQDHISIADVKQDVVLLKDGGAVVVLKTTAVNFGLLSGEEQMAIIGSFAQMLNSLSFQIQIVIRSKRLDITSYLQLLDKALQLQTNPLLAQMMARYRNFIQSLIKDNEVLDKSFYVVVPLSGLEIGIGARSPEDKLKKIMAALSPRRDQVIRQLSRVGLNAISLKNAELVKLFFEIYNPVTQTPVAQIPQVNLQTQPSYPPQPAPNNYPIPNRPAPIQQPAPMPQNQTMTQPSPARNHPFVVEELTDSL